MGENTGQGKNMFYKENNGPIDAKRLTNERERDVYYNYKAKALNNYTGFSDINYIDINYTLKGNSLS